MGPLAVSGVMEMRSLLVLMLLAQPVMADYYLVNIPSDKMADLVMTHNIPMPSDTVIGDTGVWGVIEAETEHTSMYVDSSAELVSISRSTYQALRRSCGPVTPSCVQHILDERGNDQASID